MLALLRAAAAALLLGGVARVPAGDGGVPACATIDEIVATCDENGDVVLSIAWTNDAPFVAEHMFLIVETPAGATVAPSYVDLPSVPPAGGHVIGPVVLSGAGDAVEACIRLTIHAADLDVCCSTLACFPLPDCTPDPCDLDGDGDVDFQDLLILLSAWGPCPPPPCPADIDGDGAVEFDDLLILLSCWTV